MAALTDPTVTAADGGGEIASDHREQLTHLAQDGAFWPAGDRAAAPFLAPGSGAFPSSRPDSRSGR